MAASRREYSRIVEDIERKQNREMKDPNEKIEVLLEIKNKLELFSLSVTELQERVKVTDELRAKYDEILDISKTRKSIKQCPKISLKNISSESDDLSRKDKNGNPYTNV